MSTRNSNYYIDRDFRNIKKISKYLEKLPDYCLDFFLNLESYTSTLTRLNYAMDLEIFFDFIAKFKFGKDCRLISFADIEKVTSADITSFLSYLSFYNHDGKNYKNGERGKARKLASVRSFFKYLFSKDLISKDIASKVPTPKIHDKEIIRLEIDEVVKIINQAETASNLTDKQRDFHKLTSERDVAMLSLFLTTGIRVSECVGLNVNDFDFEHNAFKITRKGGNQTILYFSDELKVSLLKWLEIRQQKNISEDEQAMFLSIQNKRISVRAVENLVKKYAKIICPLKNISPHKLRSTYGTNLYRETGDIYIVADVLGHKDVNTTKKHYAAISEDMRRNVAKMIKLREDKN